MKRLVLIPARSGSTRVANKNLRPLCERPLLAHVITTALSSDCDRVIVSTDSEEIAETARRFGAEVPFLRPARLATSEASSLSAILHALAALKEMGHTIPELVAFCPPTNPLLRQETISTMFENLESRTEANSIVTITRPRTHPFRIIRRSGDGHIENGVISIEGRTVNDVERSQDWPQVWEGTPACRMTRAKYFLDVLARVNDAESASGKTYDVANCLGHEIPFDEAFDIDEEEDFALAAFWLERRLKTS